MRTMWALLTVAAVALLASGSHAMSVKGLGDPELSGPGYDLCNDADRKHEAVVDPADCRYFYYCVLGDNNEEHWAYRLQCPDDLAFQQEDQRCDWPEYVAECLDDITTTAGPETTEETTTSEAADTTTEAAETTTSEATDTTTSEATDTTTEAAETTTSEAADTTTEAAESTTSEAADTTTEAADTTTEAADTTTEAAETTTSEAADTTMADTTTEAADTTTEAAETTTSEAADTTTEAAETTTSEAAESTTSEAADTTTEAADTTTEAAVTTTSEAADTTTEAAESTTSEAADTTTEAAETTISVAADTTTEAAETTTSEAADTTTEAAETTTSDAAETTTSTVTDSTAEPIFCPAGWDQFEGQCYFFSRERKHSYVNAHLACWELGGHLVEIHSQAENDFIVAKLMSLVTGPHDSLDYWTGLDRLSNATWQWRTSGAQPTFTNWWPDQGSLNGYVMQLLRKGRTEPNTLDSFYWVKTSEDVTDGDNGYVCQMPVVQPTN